MRNELQMDSGTGKAKYIVLGVIAMIFAVGAYALIGKDSPPPKPQVAAAPASVLSRAADPALPAAEPLAETTAAMPSDLPQDAAPAVDTMAAPAPYDNSVVASAAVPDSASALATAEPTMPAADNHYSDAGSDLFDELASAEDEVSAQQNQNRPAVRKPPPPATDTLSAWWRSSSENGFAVQYVGQASAQPALVIRFSQGVDHPDEAARHIELLSESGTPVAGSWQTGANDFVLFHNDLVPGRYMLKIDATLASVSGKALPRSLSGPVYIQ